MADKTTTLKTKTNDNVYPNVIGDNRDNAISDSPQIKHTLTANHKINFRLDTNVSGLIFNSLQKPSGITKTELVGVGANGQENIEIGDNLTLSNGKLSATGGSSGGGTEIKSTNIYFRYRQNMKDWKVGDAEYLDSELVDITPVNTKTVCYLPYDVSTIIQPYKSNTATLLIIYEATNESSGYVKGRINIVCLKAGSSSIDLSLTQKRLYTE